METAPINLREFLLASINKENEVEAKELENRINSFDDHDISRIYQFFVESVKESPDTFIHSINDYGKSFSVKIITGMSFLR